MNKPNATAAYAAAAEEFAEQLADLHRIAATLFDLDPERVNWADVGSLHAHVAALREITDCHFRRGEYARDAV